MLQWEALRNYRVITFHQSYSYEDFVEGYRPVTIRINTNTGNKDNYEREMFGSNIVYRVVDGIFKRISIIALYDLFRSLDMIDSDINIADIDIDNDTYRRIKEIVLRKLLELKSSNKLESLKNKVEKNKNIPRYLLIIDEINRGNISGIFGELITLLEIDKRIGGKDPLAITLPYSREPFGIPINLYIIGTMNTADRSIAFLDWALRRRFNFIEVSPMPDLLSDKTIEFRMSTNEPIYINLKELLKKLNEKLLEAGISRDQRIGHTYFIDVNNPGKLYIRMYQQVIPLIMEYLYNDPVGLEKVLRSLIKVKNGLIEVVDPCNNGIDEEHLYEFGEMLRELIEDKAESI